MATIGLSKPYFAIYSNSGATVSYSSGAVLGKAVEVSMSLDGASDNVLYADNGPAESDNQFGGGTITITTDDLNPTIMKTILGLEEEAITDTSLTTTSPKWLNYNDSQAIPYCAFAGVIKKKIGGAIKYVAFVLPKIQFINLPLSATTQGETIEWQTPEIEATILRDDTADHTWQKCSTLLDTEADAIAIIEDFLDIQ